MSLRSSKAIQASIPARLTFMIVDIAIVDENCATNDNDNIKSCTVQLFGVTAEGHSVCCRVLGFQPCVYVQCPPTWATSELEAKKQQFIDHIEQNCADRVPDFKRGLAACSVVLDKRNIFGYCGNETERLLRLSFHTKQALDRFCAFLSGETKIEKVRDDEADCFQWRVEHLPNGERDARRFEGKQEFWLCDDCLTPLQQFINHSAVTPSGWVTVKEARENNNGKQRKSRCQYDLIVDLSNVTPNDERDDIAPLIVESFDIECLRAADDGQMPDAQVAADSIIQIGSTVWRFGDDSGYVCQVVHCVGQTTLTAADDGPAEQLEIRCYDDEAAMLSGYMRYMREEIDPDIRIAYNSQGFDHHYLQQRLERCFPDEKAKEREYGRLCGDVVEQCKSSYGGSRAHGGRTRLTVRAPGRVDFDLMLHARHSWRIFRGGLDGLARSVLQRGKDAVTPAEIRAHWLSGDAARRGIVARYCAVDTELTLQVTKRRQVLLEALEMSRLCGIPLDKVFNCGVSQRACALLAREAYRSGYVQPEEPRRYVRDAAMQACLFDGSVQGALVLEPKPGCYQVPICTVDFASLYPSIMRGHGLCWTTLILDPQKWIVERNTPHVKQRIVEPNSGAECVLHWATLPAESDDQAKPLLYRILTKLLDARKAAKQKMAQAKADNNAFLTSLYDAKQLAIKIVCNSMYGHCNCRFTPLFCPPIAAAVTDHGRRLLQQAKDFVEIECGYNVIYGDSDSLLIDFGADSDREAFNAAFVKGLALVCEFNKRLVPEIRLEFEKVFYPFAMWSEKKKYCGVLYSKPEDKGVIVSKGMEKSDTLPLVLQIERSTVQNILSFADQSNMVQCVEDLLAPLSSMPASSAERQARDLALVDQLIVVKRLSREPRMYLGSDEIETSKGKRVLPPHVLVALDIAERCPGRAPCAGDPVEFVWALDGANKSAGKVPIDVEQFKSQPQRFRLHLPHYISSFSKRVVSLFELPNHSLIGGLGEGGSAELVTSLLSKAQACADSALHSMQPLARLFAHQQQVSCTPTAATATKAIKRDVAEISERAHSSSEAASSGAVSGKAASSGVSSGKAVSGKALSGKPASSGSSMSGSKVKRQRNDNSAANHDIAQMAHTMQMFLSGRK